MKDIDLDSLICDEIHERVRFEDTDAGGVMYFGRACRWIESGFNELFRKHLISLLLLKDKYIILFNLKWRF